MHITVRLYILKYTNTEIYIPTQKWEGYVNNFVWYDSMDKRVNPLAKWKLSTILDEFGGWWLKSISQFSTALFAKMFGGLYWGRDSSFMWHFKIILLLSWWKNGSDLPKIIFKLHPSLEGICKALLHHRWLFVWKVGDVHKVRLGEY